MTIEDFGYKKLKRIESFLIKVSQGHILAIQNVEIVNTLTSTIPDVINSFEFSLTEIQIKKITTMVIHYHASNYKGLYWEITEKPKIEKMVLDVFALNSLGIKKIQLKHINEHIYW
jgi:hypothetical protein